jgi:hypothetical protein
LKFARAVGAGNGNCGPGDAWQCDSIETTGNAALGEAMGVSLAVWDGQPMIAYYDDDAVNGRLKIARRNFGGNCGPFLFGAQTWQCETVDNGVVGGLPIYDVGQYAALARHPQTGRATIAYYDATNDNLRVAAQVFQTFVPMMVGGN